MQYSALEHMEIQFAALYNCDEHGRMLSVNEPGTPAAPRFFMGRTSEGTIVRLHADLPADIVATLTSICAAEPITSDLESPPLYAAAIRTLLGTNTVEYRGPAFFVPESLPEVAGAIIVQPDQLDVFREHYAWLITEYLAWSPVAAVLVDGQAVSVCFCSRIRPISAEAGLDTIKAFRRRGYARAATATWARHIQAQGMLAFYSTSWDNTGSRNVARSLGLQLFGEHWSM